MPDGLSLEAVLQIVALPLALISVAITYILTERSRRREFERERKYDRRREHYETALAALRRSKDARELFAAQELDASAMQEVFVLKGLPEKTQREFAELVLPWFKRLSAFLLEARFAETRQELRGKAESLAAPEAGVNGDSSTFATFMYVYMRSEDEFARSVSGLALLGAPIKILDRMRSIKNRILEGVAQENWSWFDDEMSNLEEMIRQDLQAIIVGRA